MAEVKMNAFVRDPILQSIPKTEIKFTSETKKATPDADFPKIFPKLRSDMKVERRWDDEMRDNCRRKRIMGKRR